MPNFSNKKQRDLRSRQHWNKLQNNPRGLARTLDSTRVTIALKNLSSPKFMEKYKLSDKQKLLNEKLKTPITTPSLTSM